MNNRIYVGSVSVYAGMHTGLDGRTKRALNHISVNIYNNYILGLHNAVSHAARLYRHKVCLRISDAYISSGKLYVSVKYEIEYTFNTFKVPGQKPLRFEHTACSKLWS